MIIGDRFNKITNNFCIYLKTKYWPELLLNQILTYA